VGGATFGLATEAVGSSAAGLAVGTGVGAIASVAAGSAVGNGSEAGGGAEACPSRARFAWSCVDGGSEKSAAGNAVSTTSPAVADGNALLFVDAFSRATGRTPDAKSATATSTRIDSPPALMNK
jgi:hypothetical protein